MNSESQLHTAASLQETGKNLNPAVSYESGDEWDTIELTDSQVKNLEKSEEAVMSVVQPMIKEEPQSDNDKQFIGEFISGSYEGPHILAQSIKQEFISPNDLEAYNKNAVGDKDKLVLVQEKISNVYDVQTVYGKEQFEELLKGVHRNRHRQNIAHVESLKENITQSLKEKDVSSCRTLEDAECNREKEDTDEARKAWHLEELFARCHAL